MNIDLVAYANGPFETVSNVGFYDGSNFLGLGQPISPVVPIFPPQPGLADYYHLVWSNPPPSAYSVTAVATASNGGTATSTPVSITVLGPLPPPPTNMPTLVTVSATSPIAIDGTNCWTYLGGPITWSNWISSNGPWQWVTNCGPQDAIFTIHRYGSTNDDLVVDYSLGGTATNGVDYAALPGSVTIPAGQTDAAITIIPTDTNAAPPSTTVIIGLTPDTNVLPSYFAIGPRAEAIIIGSVSTNFPFGFLADRSFSMNLTGPDGAWFRIDGSTNLTTWTPICTNQVVNGMIEFIDPNATNFNSQMYRAVPLPATPGE